MFWWDEQLRSPKLHTPHYDKSTSAFGKGRPTNYGLCGEHRHTPMRGNVSFISLRVFWWDERSAVSECSSLYVAERALALLFCNPIVNSCLQWYICIHIMRYSLEYKGS